MSNENSKKSKKNTIKITEEHIQKSIEIADCPICIEKFNNSSHKKIKCEYCIFEACKDCFQKYLLIENEPRCMNNDCNRRWTPEFISNHFTKRTPSFSLKTSIFGEYIPLKTTTSPMYVKFFCSSSRKFKMVFLVDH
jgi:hypothetical protein